ncbi:MAG: chorismate mutase [Eubacterium sp.]|nr:chorismate mutase [Eubacterium sp.]
MGYEELKNRLADTDREMLKLFRERMQLSAGLEKARKEENIPETRAMANRQIMNMALEEAPEEMRDYLPIIYSQILELSKSYRHDTTGGRQKLTEELRQAIQNTSIAFPENASVACQGVEGANSQLACERLFPNANILFFNSFDAVFTAIEKGLCRYGIIPIENSTAGSVNAVYDLMAHHNFSIVRSIRLKVEHNLLANEGVDLSEIREIYSHEQAIAQCSEFLKTLKGVRVIPCENTALAAKMVSQSGRRDMAALSSRLCAEYYDLNVLKASVQNTDNNYTRFICISREMEIYPGADRTSLMLTLPHKPGSLYKVLARIYACGVNLNKLESRPQPSREFEFTFYFDLDVPVSSPRFLRVMEELPHVCETFRYFGSYAEVI